MQIQSSYITLRGVRMHARHGVLPQETVVGADFIVDVRVGYNVERAIVTDDVRDTLSYADIYDIVKREMARPSRLVEHVAGRMGEALLKAFPAIVSVDLSVTKVNPPMGACCDGAGVEIHLINDGCSQSSYK